MILSYQGRDFTWPKSVLDLSQWLVSNWYVPPVAFGIIAMVYLLLRGSWHSFPVDTRLRLMCQSLIDQITADVPESEAIRNAAAIADERSLSSESNPTFKSPRMVQLLTNVQTPLLDVPGASEEDTLIARLKYLSAIHEERSRRHEYFWSRFLPRFAMVLIGGGFVLAYAWWVIAPVYLQVARW
jgi:hypothetical protein